MPLTQNLILLIFKFYVYKSRFSGNLSFSFFHKLVKIKKIEMGTILRTLNVYKKKWSFKENSLSE